MKNKENQLIWESYEDVSVARLQGDEHNPGEPSNVDTGAMYQAMDKAQQLEHIASKYKDMTDAQLQAHAEVIDALIEAGEEYRTRYFDGEVGAPF